MIKALKNMLPYLVVTLMDFYLLPLLIKDTGSAMMILLVVVPLICFVCSMLYGAKNSFHWLYAMTVAILFIPTIFIFYNSSAWVYIVGYSLIALIGNVIGMIIYKAKK